MLTSRQTWFLLLSVAFLGLVYVVLNTSDDFGYASQRIGIDPRRSRLFRNVIVHLDLKGAPPRVEYLEEWFALLARQFVDGVLIEYEDTFPYSGQIEHIKRDNHYSEDDVRRIIATAERHRLEVIPLIQSFGHLEFVLKRPQFSHLSEDIVDFNTICISDPKSTEIVHEMIRQMRRLHPNSTRIHIGADEAYHVGEDSRCHSRMIREKMGRSQLKMQHIASVGQFAKEVGFSTVFAWNDMFDKEPETAIRNAGLHKYIVPVVWGYREDVTEPGYFPDGLFDRIYNVFDGFYVASAFKGADGARQQFSNVSHYLQVQKSYVKLMGEQKKASRKVEGIFVTGWSRYNHFNALCELQPVAIPSLIADLFYLNYQIDNERQIWNAVKTALHCQEDINDVRILVPSALTNCSFPGNTVFELMTNEWHVVLEQKQFGGLQTLDAITVLNRLKNALKSVLFESDIEELGNQLIQDLHSIRHPTIYSA